METFERIRILRKQHLKLSQEQFGEMLGVSRTVIKNIELDNLARPEQKEPLLRLICEKFHVNYKWLTSGEGEMLVTTKQTFLERLSEEYGLSSTARGIIESYLNLDDDQRTVVDNFIKSIAETLNTSEGNSGVVDEAADKTMAIYRAARSDDNTEKHEIIEDGKGTVDKLSNAPPVIDTEDF